jgi:RecB family exonuclease
LPVKGRFAELTSWSFSVYTRYLKCPFEVCLDKIQRVRVEEPENPFFVKGNRVHAAADAAVSGKGKMPKLTAEMLPIKEQLVSLRARGAKTEQEWAFDKTWNLVDWRDWKRAWLRIKTDVCADTLEPPTVDIVDWKTGKVHPEHAQQRSLYALGGLQLVQLGLLAGGSKKVDLTAQHVYVDTGQSATEKFTMKHLAPLKREWLARIDKMMKDTTYKAQPGYHCKYCKFRKSNGGPCPEDK